MATINSSVYGLIIISLGLLGVIISFLIADRRRYATGLFLSGLIVAMGLYQSVGASLRDWRTSRRIAKLQDQQRLNLEALQERLRQTRGPAAKASAPSPAPAPASASAPAGGKKPPSR